MVEPCSIFSARFKNIGEVWKTGALSFSSMTLNVISVNPVRDGLFFVSANTPIVYESVVSLSIVPDKISCPVLSIVKSDESKIAGSILNETSIWEDIFSLAITVPKKIKENEYSEYMELF